MTDKNASPVSLPAGSYEYEALKKGLGAAAGATAPKYDEAVAKALDGAATRGFEPVEPRFIPGTKFIEREHELLGVKETIQVFDAKSPEAKEAAADQADQASGEARMRNQQAATRADAESKG